MAQEALENILFGMPKDAELFLAALAAVQDYGEQMGRRFPGNRDAWFLAVYIPNQKMDFLKPCFPAGTAFVEDWDPWRGEWDLVYDFESSPVYEVSLPTMKTATTVFGLLIGAAPASEFPDLSALGETARGPDVVILPFEGAEQLKETIELQRPELEVSMGDGWLYPELLVGPRSFETYMAASLNKRVVELYPTDTHRFWLSKWSSLSYQQIYGDWFPVELVWRGIEGVLAKWPITATQTKTPA